MTDRLYDSLIARVEEYEKLCDKPAVIEQDGKTICPICGAPAASGRFYGIGDPDFYSYCKQFCGWFHKEEGA